MRTVKDFRKQIAFIAVVAALCFGFTAAARLADTDGASASEAAVSYLTEDESAPDVSMSYENGALTISGLTGEANLIRASYSGGILTGIEFLDAANGTQTIAADPGDRFFLWDDTGSMRPLSETAIVGEEDVDQDGGALVVYFSATGNTERVAGYIASAADADVFEIAPTDPYTSEDLRWTDENSRVSVEHNNPDQREVELVSTTVPDWESYDTVFIGYPIW